MLACLKILLVHQIWQHCAR